MQSCNLVQQRRDCPRFYWTPRWYDATNSLLSSHRSTYHTSTARCSEPDGSLYVVESVRLIADVAEETTMPPAVYVYTSV